MILPMTALLRGSGRTAMFSVASTSWRVGAASSSPSSSMSSACAEAPRRRLRRLHSASNDAAPATITIARLVRQLRDATGAPMMECKKALSQPGVDGDVARATEWLRKHGSARVLSKVSGREAHEGLVGIKVAGGGFASVVRVSSETDFASRSDALSSFVQEVADAAAASAAAAPPSSPDDRWTTSTIDDVPSFLRGTRTTAPGLGDKTLEDRLGDAVLAIRENLRVDSIAVLRSSSPRSVLGGYVHGRSSPASTCGTAASIVQLVPIIAGGGGGGEGVDGGRANEAARKLAMHVVAARPAYLDAASVPADVVEKEREVYAEKARAGAEGGKPKPPDIVEKIVSGQLRKFYEGVCLSEQAHMVEEGSPKVSKALADLGLEVRSFVLVGMGK
jgi:elongation factor Ts